MLPLRHPVHTEGRALRRLPFPVLTSCSAWSSAEEIRWGFATADGMPYVEVVAQQLHGGFIYRLGQQASEQPGYVYGVPLMAAFANQQIIRQDLRDPGSGLNLPRKQRLDAIIEMRRPASFKLTKLLDAPLQTLRDQAAINRLLGDT